MGGVGGDRLGVVVIEVCVVMYMGSGCGVGSVVKMLEVLCEVVGEKLGKSGW